jgi:hypothetical protein
VPKRAPRRMKQVVVRMPGHWHDVIVEEAERMEVSTAHYIREAAWLRAILAREARGLTPEGGVPFGREHLGEAVEERAKEERSQDAGSARASS